ncbi:MAG: anaerobic ribonucleoside-triphosphate reductase [Agathobacter sp.]|nr:anaerobic ribonucleoside-triphosphate reductase [Agathobacter sp.]
MKIIKRSGSEVVFDVEKIVAAIIKANESVLDYEKLSDKTIEEIARNVENACENMKRSPSVEEIQDMVENQLMNHRAFNVARNYITYRYKRALVRKSNSTDEQILSLLECNNEEVKQENSNKNPTVNSVQRDYMAGEVSKDITKRFLLPEDVVEAHEKGLIHFHDADYFAQHMHNCCLVNLEDMLQNGTVISETMIDPPKSFSTACNIATQAIAQIASSQYGGQSISLTHLAPFVQVSREKFRQSVKAEFEAVGIEYTEQMVNDVAELRVKEEINRGVQMIQYQVITLMTTNGQAPFITVFMYLNEAKDEQTKADLAAIIEEMLHQRIQGVKNEKGVYITPAFPKLIYVLEEDNIREGTKYWELTKLAAKCTAKRMVPDYISEKKMLELKVDKNGEGHCYTCMGCRSFLTPYVDPETNQPKYYGRFNQGVVTLNLVDVACSSEGDEKKFWEIMDERLELCYRALMCRHKRLLGTPSDVAPILWQNGALARLEKGEKLDKLLFGGYSTISLGYAGLNECVRYMKGVSHTDPEVGTPFGLAVMRKLNEACKKWKAENNMDFSLYGTPLESTTYKFAKCLQKRFGVIEGVTDRNYITNSYHVHVTEEMNAFDKLKFEAQFQELSPGGAISYVEVPNMQNNIEAVLSVMQYIYDNIMYAELNTKSDYCQKCGFDGEIQIVSEEGSGKLVWECPNCGNRDQDQMSVARRTCGYIGTQFWNQGRTQEIKERVLHL